MTTHSSILVGNHMNRRIWQATVHSVTKKVRHDLAMKQQQKSFKDALLLILRFNVHKDSTRYNVQKNSTFENAE